MEDLEFSKNQMEQEMEERKNDLIKREGEVEKKERELSILEASILGAKYNLYGKVNASLSTMNIVVGVIAIILVATIIFAVIAS